MRLAAATSIIAMIVASTPAKAKDVAVISLARTSPWNVNYTPDSCQLITIFGSEAQRVIFRLSRDEPGSDFNLELMGRPLRTGDTGTSQLIGQPRNSAGSDASVELSFGLDATPIKRSSSAMTISSAGQTLPMVRLLHLNFDETSVPGSSQSVPTIDPAREAAVVAISFKVAGSKRYRLETGSMAPPMAAIRKCTDDLVKSWGYDLATEANLRRHATPLGSPSEWLLPADYPNKAIMQGHNGLVRFRLDLDAAGLPQGCHVLYRTNPDEFADLSCRLLMQRARFSPAQDSIGLPVKSFYINDIRWTMFVNFSTD